MGYFEKGDIDLYKRMLAMIRPYWRRLALAMVFMIAVSGAAAATAYLVKPAMDDVFVNKNKDMLAMIPLAVIILYAIKGFCSYGQSYLMQYVGQSIISEFRINLFTHLQRLPLSYYDRMSTGEIMSRITNDVNQIQAAVTSVVTGLLLDVFTIIGLTCVVIYQDWFLAIFALGVFPVCVIPIVRLGKRLRKISSRSQTSMADMNVLLHETLTGARIVKGFCREEYESRRFSAEAMRLFALRMKDVATRALSHPLMEFLGGFGIAAIIFYGGWQVMEGKSTPGTFFSFLAALLMLYEPIKRLSNMNNDVQNGLAAATRVYQVLDTEPDIVSLPDAKVLEGFSKSIEFRDVYFEYRKDEPVLNGINLKVSAGSLLALVGTSGGGKTTMVNLLPRFYEVARGGIFIDDQDIRSFTIKSLRSQIAIVTQQTFLFNDTVKANIAYGRLEASDTEIRQAAQAAYALDFVENLPQGFDTVIGESGMLLSGGERQRLSIARAILANRPILILDEATSSLDTESELYVQKALENLMQGRTTFVIAHRLSTVRQADHIVVMSEGRIVEEGRHLQLLALNGTYYKLHNMQQYVDQGMTTDEEN